MPVRLAGYSANSTTGTSGDTLRVKAFTSTKGALHSRLETFEWQAPAFYVKHGYRELARMPRYYQNYSLSLMVKEL